MSPSPSLFRVASALSLGGLSAALTLGGCGARGPLDDAPPADAASPEPLRSTDPDAGDRAPAPAPVPEAIDAGREAGVLECGVCVLRSCGQKIGDCIRDEACRAAFQCIATTCFGLGGGADAGAGGGGLNPRCLLECARQEPDGAAGVLAAFQCVMTTCGPECAELLGALPGLGGLGGGGNGFPANLDFRDAPEEAAARAAAFADVFSPWPELLSRPAEATAPPP